MELMSPPQRKSKVMSLEDAVALIKDGDTIAIGGVHSHLCPMAVIREIARQRKRNLTVVPAPSIGIALDILIAAGCVSKVHVCYVGLEFVGFAPAFRRACERGELEVIEADEPWVVFGLRAGAAGLPFVPFPPLYEATDLPKINPMIKKTIDPYTGREVSTIPAIRPDVGLIMAQKSDPWGNAHILGQIRYEALVAKASDKCIVCVDDVTSELDPVADPMKPAILGPTVTAVVEAAYGAHPTSSAGHYNYDEDHLRLYARMAREGAIDEYLETYVYGPKDNEEYLERVGLRNLLKIRFK